MMKLSIDRAVDYSGREAVVGVAAGYRRCHRSRAVCDEALPAAKCLDVVRDPQPQWLEAIVQSD
jgi:hypothetical protein